jgi:hypothetical protein
MLKSAFVDGSKLLRAISILGYEERDPLHNAREGKQETTVSVSKSIFDA